MAYIRLTAIAQAFARAALKDQQSLEGKSDRWVARNVADKLIHADKHYSVREQDTRPIKQSQE